MKQKAILILGMHRSGTSMLTNILEKLGVHLGQDLLQPMSGVNEKGFWEHRQVVEAHERLLLSLGRAWYDLKPFQDGWETSEAAGIFKGKIKAIIQKEFADSKLWGVKDPRLCLFLPLWEDVLQELKIETHFIVVLRNPLEIALSLARRDSIFPLHALSLNQRYMGEVARNITHIQKSFSLIAYPDLIVDWAGCLTKTGEQLQLAWPVSPESLDDTADGVVESSLKHQNVDDSVNIELQELLAITQYWRDLSPYTPKPHVQTFLERTLGFWKSHHDHLIRLEESRNEYRRLLAEHDMQLAERDMQLAERDMQLADLEIKVETLKLNWLGRLCWNRFSNRTS